MFFFFLYKKLELLQNNLDSTLERYESLIKQPSEDNKDLLNSRILKIESLIKEKEKIINNNKQLKNYYKFKNIESINESYYNYYINKIDYLVAYSCLDHVIQYKKNIEKFMHRRI